MPDDANTPIDLAHQLRAHLESLQAAGVLFVPWGTSTPLRAAAAREVAQVVATPEPPLDPLETRRRELEVLRGEVAACDRCSELFSTRTQTVFGSGSLDAEVVFVGDAPGSAEDAQGEPFVGKGGPLLARIIGACGFTHDRVYLSNVIKCRPPASRAPTAAECANCRVFLDRQLDLVMPKYLVALGAVASRLLAGRNVPLGQLRGTILDYRGVPLICTHHPDDIEKDASGARKRETWEDLKMLLRAMGRPIPTPK
jgi:uracil-DNA glycosylase